MIRLAKGPLPPVLATNGQVWTDEYVAASTAGTLTDAIRYRYRHPEIKAAIKSETSEKCAYCESKVTHVYPGDVEHIVPKSTHPDQVLAWNNLTYACSVCNNKKGEYDEPANPLLNPYTDEPGDHLTAFGPCIFHVRTSVRGEITQRRMVLNRSSLVERRTERIESMNNLIDRWDHETNLALKATLRDQILIEVDRDKEFSFVLRNYVRQRCGF